MTDNLQQKNNNQDKREQKDGKQRCYNFCFRKFGREYTGYTESSIYLKSADLVMVETDHGLEPALISGVAARVVVDKGKSRCNWRIVRVCNQSEIERYKMLLDFEKSAFAVCNNFVEQLGLTMSLVRVERFFNGSKIIFYFTAENRVDFRQLVKMLVQEFKTRVEMRQIGVRHETQMLGGLGSCGRELCCSGFLNKFDSVSIRMAKNQDLPLNPAKISGVCNRLLCCLAYEQESYRILKRGMPKPGKFIQYKGKQHKVIRHLSLQESIVVLNEDREELVLSREEWRETIAHRADEENRKTSAQKRKKRTRRERRKRKNDRNDEG